MPGGRGTDCGAEAKRPAVLHIEDDSLWVRVVADLLNKWPEVCHVGSVGNGHDGIRQCAEKMPAIVILDLGLPDLNGFEVLDCLNALSFPPQVLLLTCRKDQALLYRLGFGGIAGLIWKSPDFARGLRLALVALAAGRSYFPPEVCEAVHQFRSSPDAFFKILSPWELKLVSLLAQGFRDEDIAEKTGRSCSTLRSHWHNIAEKLGFHDRHEIQRWAAARGFGQAPGSGGPGRSGK